MAEIADTRPKLSLGQLFIIFFKAGCGFGGGLGVLALLQEQLVTLRRILPDKELMTLWSIGRLMPSGTMTAVAVAVGNRLCGFPGTVVALIAMIVPGFICVVGLTIAYGYLAHGAVLEYIDATLLPAALGIVVVSAVRLGKPLFRFSLDMVFVVAACLLLLVTHMNPALMLVAGGIAGAFFLRGQPDEKKAGETRPAEKNP
ncbi:MAG TPA: chromate transporter [Stellaceae bacterium]|jgi:chromate transporter|nr:chromate transporter [Stellaceae bacterium]